MSPEKLPMEHITRIAPPWRRDALDLTECGLHVVDVAVSVPRAAIEAKIKAQGQQRAALTTCMTCARTSKGNWERSPSDVLDREITRERWGRSPSPTQLDRELRAIAALVEAHREEFDACMVGLVATTDLAAYRANREVRS